MVEAKRNQPTIGDIALKAGYSTKTVMHAIHGYPDVLHKTRQTILGAAQELGYPLIGKNSSRSVGVIVPRSNDPLNLAILQEMASPIYRSEYRLHPMFADYRREGLLIDRLVSQKIDGIVFVSPHIGSLELVQSLHNKRVPVVVIDAPEEYREQPGLRRIDVDYQSGVIQAMEMLFNLDHQRIVYIGGEYNSSSNIKKLQTYEEEMGKHRLQPFWEMPLPDQADTINAGFVSMKHVLDLPKNDRPTAVLTYTDEVGLGALRACYEAGIQVPEDVSIIALGGNNDQTRYSVPAMTTVDFILSDVARRTVRQMLSMIGRRNTSPLKTSSPTPTLLIRESTGRAA